MLVPMAVPFADSSVLLSISPFAVLLFFVVMGSPLNNLIILKHNRSRFYLGFPQKGYPRYKFVSWILTSKGRPIVMFANLIGP